MWADSARRWYVHFHEIKFDEDDVFDDLLLGVYAPGGLFVYRHEDLFAVSSCGCKTKTRGHQVRIHGPAGEYDWSVALHAILAKLDASPCQRLAFVQWSSS